MLILNIYQYDRQNYNIFCAGRKQVTAARLYDSNGIGTEISGTARLLYEAHDYPFGGLIDRII